MSKANDQALVWGGLGLAAVVGAVIYQQRQTAAKAAAAAPLSPYPSIPSAGYKPPVMSAPGYVAPVVGAAPPAPAPPPPAVIIGPNAAAPTIAPPAPAVGRSAEQENADFSRINEQARQWQRDTFATGSADLLAKVQAGEIAPGSQAYRESFDYLANLTGGVATRDAEAAKLTSAGLPPPA